MDKYTSLSPRSLYEMIELFKIFSNVFIFAVEERVSNMSYIGWKLDLVHPICSSDYRIDAIILQIL